MRIRNVKKKKEIINNSKLIIKNPFDNIKSWNKIFNNDNPIYIEIGMGKGKFIIESAIKNKNINYIGIEKEESVLCRAIEKIDYLPNLRFISIDAKEIDKVFNKEIDRLYLNFSDPWPKARHAKRRLTSYQFLVKYDKIFKHNNNIFIKTDNKMLFAYSIETLTNYNYKLKNVNLDLKISEDNIETEYETKFRNQNMPINYLEAYKDNSNECIAIIGAMKEEIEYLINYYNLSKLDSNMNIYEGFLNNKKLIVTNSGVGKTNASIATQHLIDKYNPSLVINTGIAGALDDTLKTGSIVAASYLMYHDFNPYNIMKKYVGTNGVVMQDTDLLIRASSILKRAGEVMVEIPICSGDSFILDTKLKKEIKENTNCKAIDMESMAIAHTCFKNNTKSLIIRVISDNSTDENYDEGMAVKKSSNIITKIVDRI